MSKINKVDRKNEISTSEKKPENKGSTPNRNLPKKSTDIKKPENSELKLPESQTAVTKSVDIPVNLKKNLVRLNRKAVSGVKDLTADADNSTSYQAERIEHVVKGAAETVAETVYDASKSSVKTVKRSIKKGRDIKKGSSTIKKVERETAEKSSQAAHKATKAAAESAKRTMDTAKKTKEAAKRSRDAAKSLKRLVKKIVEGIKELLAAISAASLPVVLIVILAVCIGGVIASSFGIFFGGDGMGGVYGEGDSTTTLRSVITDINQQYMTELNVAIDGITHDEVVFNGAFTAWPDVLAVYAVRVTTDSTNPMEVVTLNDEKIAILTNLFYEMNTYVITTSQVPEQVEVIMLDSDGNPVLDANGAPVYTTETVMKTVLYVEMHSRSATDEAAELGFNDDQMSQLEQLLSTSNIPYWQSLLGGIIGITNTYVMPDDENCIFIYNYLRNTMGLTRAQACAIIANIQYESSFDPHALGDNGTSYGLCQWHNERWTNMQTWCANHGYDYTTVEGQCAYLEHDLVDLHSSIYNYIASVPDTPEGAYDAAAYWCIHYEVPEDAQAKSVQRGNTAIMYYWSMN